MSQVTKIIGRAISLNEDNIDTDRIIPARFLKCVTFNELGPHVFEDDRAAVKKDERTHPFDDPRFMDSTILITGSGFGSGSSREHAVHALMGWSRDMKFPGIRAIIAGGAYSEIFFANSLANGLPCVIVEREALEEIAIAFAENPRIIFTMDLEAMNVRWEDRVIPCLFQQEHARGALFYGSWDKLGILLEAKDETDKVIEKLPYTAEK